MRLWRGAGGRGRGGPNCMVRQEGRLTLLLPPEPREFQASPLLLPAPAQVPQPAARVASLLERHAIQLCQHTGRDRPRDEDWVHRASRLPVQVLPSAWSLLTRSLLTVAPISFPVSPLPLSFAHFVPLFHRLLPVCNYLAPCLKEHWSQKDCGPRTSQYGPSECPLPAVRHGW